MGHRNLDAWITGNYGEDHPDNVEDREPHEYPAVVGGKVETYIICEGCGLHFRKFVVTCPRCNWAPTDKKGD